eukprot:99203-Heterocapsa_arctica.AAC.1
MLQRPALSAISVCYQLITHALGRRARVAPSRDQDHSRVCFLCEVDLGASFAPLAYCSDSSDLGHSLA